MALTEDRRGCGMPPSVRGSDLAGTGPPSLPSRGVLKAAEYVAVARQLATARPETLPPHRRLRVAFLSNLSFRFLDPYLKVEAWRHGLLLENYFGPFGQFEQEILAPDSGLRAHKPDMLFVQMSLETLVPDLLCRYLSMAPGDVEACFENIAGRLEALAASWRATSKAPLAIFTLVAPIFGPRGIFEASDPDSLSFRVLALNRRLARLAAGSSQIYIFDYQGLVATHGAREWVDRKLWYIARLAAGARGQIALAKSLSRFISALSVPAAKCLVLDLDNTLWGGVIGDDGVTGIALGDDFPGNVFKDFQRHLIRLRDSGVLLAINSKNDSASVKEAFSHPEMILREGDFSAIRANWLAKSTNLVEIARELNLGLDALVVFDDDPVERERVRQECPEVLVLEVPNSPTRYIETLEACPWFDIPRLSGEDRVRTLFYHQDRLRRESRSRFTSIEEFLRDLGITAEVGPVGPDTFERVAQLIAKTNQMNLTARRHSPARLREMMSDPDTAVYWMRAADRFGDLGLIGVAIVQRDVTAGLAVIDTLLMSCRVLGRKLDAALLAFVVRKSSELWGARTIVGEYRPAGKNGLVADFYPRHGFRLRSRGNDAIAFELEDAEVPFPPEVAIRERKTGGATP